MRGLMAQRVTAGLLGDVGTAHGLGDGALEGRLALCPRAAPRGSIRSRRSDRPERAAYLVPATSLRSTVATVFSHEIVSVALVSVTFTKPSVSCSTDTSPVRTVMGTHGKLASTNA